MSNIIVSISCITYNQATYVRDCLEGLVRQITNFEYEILIHDDCSTDGTDLIIKEYAEKYPNLIRPIFEIENQYSKGIPIGTAIWNLPRARGKYIAFCEGDDYWIDEYKLQKQVDILENMPNIGMCFTDFNRLHASNGKIEISCLKNNPQKFPSNYTVESWIVRAGYVGPMTWLVRKKLWEEAEREKFRSTDGTFVIFTYFLWSSKVYCLKDTTAVYRIVRKSASHDVELAKRYKRVKDLHELQIKLAETYLTGQEKSNASQTINNQYYSNALKMIVATDDKEELVNSRDYCNKSLRNKLLYVIASFGLTQRMYTVIYKGLLWVKIYLNNR